MVSQNRLLDTQKVLFSEASVVDSLGRVFFYEGRVFRAIHNSKKEACIAFMNAELFKVLSEEKLMPQTWITDYEIDGYNLVIEHEFINESTPHHWSFTMYKDAVLLILKVNKICNEFGYQLKDAHPYNVFFKNNKPVFIDFGSITKKKDNRASWVAYEEFMSYCYLQLLIWEKADFFLIRKLLEDGNTPRLRTIPMSSIFDSMFIDPVAEDLFQYDLKIKGRRIITCNKRNELIASITKLVNKSISVLRRRQIQLFSFQREFKPLTYVENRIRAINCPKYESYWGNYHDTYKAGESIRSSPRFDRIIELVKEHAPDVRTAIDLAGNQGVFCYLISQKMKLERIVLTDYDEKAIDAAYHAFKDEEQSNIQPYLFNFMRPLRREEAKLIKSDIAFALAVTHHLILSQEYLLPVIFDSISRYANKYVVIEFMPVGLWAGEAEFPKIPEWYNVDWFRKEFVKKFHLLAEEQLETNRIVFVGHKILI